MKTSMKTTLFLAFAVAIMMWVVSPVAAQDKPTDNMKILLDKIKADKKLVVAANMELTESEAKGFWPVYEEFQKDLASINQRIAKLIETYAKEYKAQTLNDETAKSLAEELAAVEHTDGALKQSYVPKLNKVLPPKKVLRYLQIENKIRAALKYELAANIPIVQ